jgi:hypothetical protein
LQWRRPQGEQRYAVIFARRVIRTQGSGTTFEQRPKLIHCRPLRSTIPIYAHRHSNIHSRPQLLKMTEGL